MDHSYHSLVTSEEVLRQMNRKLNEVQELNITWGPFIIDKEFRGEKYKSPKMGGDIIMDTSNEKSCIR